METIAWTTISTSKQDPNPGLEAVRNLRDILARWAVADPEASGDCAVERLPIVYPDDVIERLMGTIESLSIVASESMQHQVYADILRTVIPSAVAIIVGFEVALASFFMGVLAIAHK